jgi:UDP-N-acetylmuramoyl-tripeptide--D-alanyl-D-alanine ligase
VRAWSPSRLARAAGARILSPPAFASGGGPERVTIDSRDVRPGDLFVGLRGERVDGGTFARAALEAGAWGVLVGPGHAGRGGRVLEADDPLAALQALAVAWRRELGADVIGVTGSTGKTSTKDLLAAMVATGRRVTATAQNLNTEIGLPLTILGAPEGTEVLVLEMAMRGAGQIAELVAIAEPDVGLITNVGPVHLEQLGTLEAIAAEKAGVIAGLRPGGTAVVPAGEPLLAPHLRVDVRTVTFGPGGDVADLGDVELPFTSAHMTRNGLAALAAARAVGVEPRGPIEVLLSARRGQRVELPGPVLVLDDCYNANPMSMRAALDELAATAGGRRVAVLGDMLELGPGEGRFHEEIGEHARDRGVDVLVTVGPRAAHMAAPFAGETHTAADAAEAAGVVTGLVAPGDTVLVKASRGVGLEVVTEALQATR